MNARRSTTLAAAVLAVAAALLPASASAALPGRNGVIAFLGSQFPASPGAPWTFTGPEILAFDPASGDFSRLTTTRPAVFDIDPAWGPGGSKIAFASNRTGRYQIWIANADGSSPSQLTSGAASRAPTWSPDGSEIAFVRNGDIWKIPTGGGKATNLTRSPNVREANPAWSDGTPQLIAFTSDRGGVGRHIWTMLSDGSQPTQLTSGNEIDVQPDFSPGGSVIVFATTRSHPSDCQGTCPRIWVMNRDGSGQRLLIEDDFLGGDADPAFAPNGRSVAYVNCVRTFGCKIVIKTFNLLRRQLGVTEAEIPRDSFESNLEPSWQPLPPAAPTAAPRRG
jgi:Tol biopolymer transport system component